MLDLSHDPNVWVAFATLTVLEIVLGIDNIVFISVLVSRLPKEQADTRPQARPEPGADLPHPAAAGAELDHRAVAAGLLCLRPGFSWQDLILLGGGLFLIYKATHEMHAEIEEPHEPGLKEQAKPRSRVIIVQIIVIDMVFSIDSIITAIGMAAARRGDDRRRHRRRRR